MACRASSRLPHVVRRVLWGAPRLILTTGKDHMSCRAGRHNWLEINAEQDGKPVRLRRCILCHRWDELRGLWMVMREVQAA
jgi:hypothetical protein